MDPKKTISTHTFMLPIKWDYLPARYSRGDAKELLDYDVRTNLSIINTFLAGSLFKRSFYKVENDVSKYNELAYFHAYVTKNLFDLQQRDEVNVDVVSRNKNVCYYTIELDEYSRYIIKTKENTYALHLDNISLHVFNTGIAVLTFVAVNKDYIDPKEILEINEFGRRFYPAYLKAGNEDLTSDVKTKFLASSIQLIVPGATDLIDDFSDYSTLENLDTHHFEHGKYQYNRLIKLPRYITGLFTKKFVFEQGHELPDSIRLNVIGDDRMYFQSWLGNKDLSQLLCNSSFPRTHYKESNYWFAFVNGDSKASDIGIANKDLQRQLSTERTYTLWRDYGTFFGFTRDSFVALSDDSEFSLNLLRVHMSTLYYQMAVLCLAQRASVLRFSAEISSLADLGKLSPELASDRIKSLYLNYIEFINKIYFREVTPQMQGIDIYKHIQQAMNIKEDIKDLDQELAELNNFSMMIKQDQQNKAGMKLNQLASIFLPASLMFGILGANFYGTSSWQILPQEGLANNLLWILIGVLPSIGFYIYYLTKNRKKYDTTN
jgi:hypothetical protein